MAYGASSNFRNIGRGFGAYQGMAGQSYTGMADAMDQEAIAAQQASAARDAQDQQREAHERALQAQEQQRRMYDSQTQRQLGQQKYGVISNLLGGPRRV